MEKCPKPACYYVRALQVGHLIFSSCEFLFSPGTQTRATLTGFNKILKMPIVLIPLFHCTNLLLWFVLYYLLM